MDFELFYWIEFKKSIFQIELFLEYDLKLSLWWNYGKNLVKKGIIDDKCYWNTILYNFYNLCWNMIIVIW